MVVKLYNYKSIQFMKGQISDLLLVTPIHIYVYHYFSILYSFADHRDPPGFDFLSTLTHTIYTQQCILMCLLYYIDNYQRNGMQSAGVPFEWPGIAKYILPSFTRAYNVYLTIGCHFAVDL